MIQLKCSIFILYCILINTISSSSSDSDESWDFFGDYDYDSSFETTESSVTFTPIWKQKELKSFDLPIPILTEEIFASYDNLSSIELNNNEIRSIDTDTFNRFNGSLIKLQIISSHLTTFNIDPISELRYLNLSNNSLTILNGTNFRELSLNSLDVSYNNLTFVYCYNVRLTINLSHNNISSIPKFSTRIQNINLSYNKIKNISHDAFYGLIFLNVLDLSHNEIFSLQNAFIKPLDVIKVFNLSYNNFTKFDPSDFLYLVKLEKLDLSHNNISIVSEYRNTKHLIRNDYFNDIRELYLAGNPIRQLNATNLSKIFARLSKISISFTNISCSMLQHHISELDANVIKGPVRNEENVNGIKCDSSLNSVEDLDPISSMLISLERFEAILIVLAIFSSVFVIVGVVLTFKRHRANIITC